MHQCMEWIETNHIETLNIAGPRESSHPSITESSSQFLHQLLSKIKKVQNSIFNL